MNRQEIARRVRAVRAARSVDMDAMTEADWRREAEELLEDGQTQKWGVGGAQPTRHGRVVGM